VEFDAKNSPSHAAVPPAAMMFHFGEFRHERNIESARREARTGLVRVTLAAMELAEGAGFEPKVQFFVRVVICQTRWRRR
jgi:hypothetical protein